MSPIRRALVGHRFDVLAALAVAGFVLCRLILPAPATLIQADSSSYLEFLPFRTAGYPLLLRLIRHLPGGLDLIPALQLGLYGLAAWFFAMRFRALTGTISAALLLVMLLANTQVIALGFMIMTDMPAIALVTAALALVAGLAKRPSVPGLALLSLIIGLGAMIRPVAEMQLVVVPLAWWWCRRTARVPVLAAAAIGPFLACWLAGITLFHAEHGLWRSEVFLGDNLIGKAALVVDRDVPSRRPEVMLWIADQVEADQQAIAKAPTFFDRFRLQGPYYDIWIWHMMQHGLPQQLGLAPDDLVGLDRAMTQFSIEIIAARPSAYLSDVALNDAALWWLPDAMTDAELTRFRSLLAQLEPLPDLGTYPPWHREHGTIAVWLLHGFMMLALAASVVAPMLASWRWLRGGIVAPALKLATAAALMVHAQFLATAALQAGMPRYSWGMWPAVALLAVTMLSLSASPNRRSRA